MASDDTEQRKHIRAPKSDAQRESNRGSDLGRTGNSYGDTDDDGYGGGGSREARNTPRPRQPPIDPIDKDVQDEEGRNQADGQSLSGQTDGATAKNVGVSRAGTGGAETGNTDNSSTVHRGAAIRKKTTTEE